MKLDFNFKKLGKNAVPLAIAIAVILAVIVGLAVWKLSSSSDMEYDGDEFYYDFEDDDDKDKKKNKKKKDKKKDKKNRDDDDDDDDDGKVKCDKVLKNVRKMCGRGESMAAISRKYDEGEVETCGIDLRAECSGRFEEDDEENPDAENCEYKCKSKYLKRDKPCATEDGQQCCNKKMKNCLSVKLDDVAIAGELRREGVGSFDQNNTGEVFNYDGCDYVARMPDSASKEDWSCPKDFKFYIGDSNDNLHWLDKMGMYGRQCSKSNDCRKKTKDAIKSFNNDRDSTWDCKKDGNKVAEVTIDWGHAKDDAVWACNEWKGECGRGCNDASEH